MNDAAHYVGTVFNKLNRLIKNDLPTWRLQRIPLPFTSLLQSSKELEGVKLVERFQRG